MLILVRYREAFAGRVIELGCGAGRVLGYMTALSDDVAGVDLSPAMVDYCRRAYPSADVRVGDLAHLDGVFAGPFDVIFATSNVIDVLDHAERRRVLADLRERLAQGGMLVFSSHNLADLDRAIAVAAPPTRGQRALKLIEPLLRNGPGALGRAALRVPWRVRNRRRLSPLQSRGEGFAVVNDGTFDYSLLHYFVDRDAQERQLREAGYELIECLDREGLAVAPGEAGPGPWLHYIARRATL